MARLFQLQPAEFSTAGPQIASSSAGGPLNVVLAANTGGGKRVLTQINGYLAAPTSQTLTVYDGTSSGTAIFATGINSTMFDLKWDYPLRGSNSNAITVVVSSASTGWVYLNAMGFTEAP